MPIKVGRWLAIYFAFVGVPLLALAAFNLRSDPFHIFHNDGQYVIDQRYQRFMHAGMLRTEGPIKTLLVGTSYVANFSPELMAERFGGLARVVSTWGASQRENLAVARLAFSHHPEIETVLFEESIWNACNVSLHPSWTFPTEIYEERLPAFIGYLLSFETSELSLKKLWASQSYSSDASKVVRWWDEHKAMFGNQEVLRNAFAGTIAPPPNPAVVLDRPDVRADAVVDCYRKLIVPLAQEHPSVQFNVFNPPVMQWLLWAYNGHGYLEPWLVAQNKMAALTETVPNLRYFDFYATIPQLTRCSYWWDMSHFDLRVSDMIVNWIADGQYQRKPGNAAEFDGPIREAARAKIECPA